jgi:YD repeat-containing protein
LPAHRSAARSTAGQLTTIVDRKAQRREFVYDNDGRRTQEKWCTTSSGDCTASRIFTYTYDAASQLTEVNEPDSRYTLTDDNEGR